MKPLLHLLRGQPADRTPIWLMRQAGRYLPEYRKVRAQAGNFLTLCYTPKLALEVTLQPIRRYGFDAAILFSDILVIPDALGQSVAFKEGEGPQLDPITDLAGMAKLNPHDITERLAPVYQAVSDIRAALPGETALIGFAGAPWTVATYMVAGHGTPDQAPAKNWARQAPADFQQLIDLLTAVTTEHLLAQIAAGAEIVQLFDTWAGSLPEPEFRRWSLEPAKAIVAGIRQTYPDIPVIGFPRGAGALYHPYLIETGITGVSLDSSVDLAWAHDRLQPEGVVQGNLDPAILVAGGPALDRAIDDILEKLGKGRFIFNLGHGIVPQTPPDNVARLVARVREAGV